MTFDWGELVAVSSGAPSDYRPGSRGWVVGMPANDESVGSGQLPSASSVYLVEFRRRLLDASARDSSPTSTDISMTPGKLLAILTE